MVTSSDRYGDLDLEDLVDDELEGLEPDEIDAQRPIDFGEAIFQKGEVRSFEQDFGDTLDSTLALMDEEDPEWSDEFIDEVEAQEYFERHTLVREEE